MENNFDPKMTQLNSHQIIQFWDQIDHNSLYLWYWVIIFNSRVLISEISGYVVVLDLLSIFHNVKRGDKGQL